MRQPLSDRLEKYAVEPIVAKSNDPASLDVQQALRHYRNGLAKHDPFPASRAASSHITVLSSQDLSGEVLRRLGATAGASFFPVAEMYLRVGGKLAAAITLFRDPLASELSLGEIWMLRDLHRLCEHAYGLATKVNFL